MTIVQCSKANIFDCTEKSSVGLHAVSILLIYPLHTNSGCGKREAHMNWSMVRPAKAAAPVAGTTLRTVGLVPADSRQ